MFTGIVQDIGRIEAREPCGGDVRLRVAVDRFDLSRTAVGDSICVQGVCLTVVNISKRSFDADVSRETLALTTLGELEASAAVNLEPALRAGEDMHFNGLLGAVSLWHGPAADVVAFLDVGDRGLVNGDDRRVVGELDRGGCAVGSLDEQNVAVDSLDSATQALGLLGVSRGSNKSSDPDGG